MSKQNRPNENCKQRFKAIESFLRRVAFNLGNTASQTEVKIISCIPIDVTDLQQKICFLEKELEETKKKVPPPCMPAPCMPPPCMPPTCCAPAVIQTAICRSSSFNAKGDDIRSDLACNANSCYQSNLALRNDSRTRYRDYSLCSFTSRGEPSRECQCYSDHVIHSFRAQPCCESGGSCKRFFSKMKHKNKKNYNTQFVYYAQTSERSPFNSYSYSDDVAPKKAHRNPTEKFTLSRTFLADVFQKQYKPEPIMKVFSSSSNFSAPVCRDIATSSSSWKCNCESEVCSCCCGTFHNRYKNKKVNAATTSAPNHKNRYYDSNLYDMVPVRENAAYNRNKIEVPKRKKSKRPVIVKGKNATENRSPKFRVPPVVVNYHQILPSPRTYNIERLRIKNTPSKIRRKQMVLNEMAKRRTSFRPTQLSKGTKRISSKICSVDYGPVYKKQQEKESKQKDAASSMPSNTSAVKTENLCQVNSSSARDPEGPVPEVNAAIDKTEMTLNQIKAILQSVLLEVKINSKFGKSTDTPKKDAIVQNGVSHDNMFSGSQLLQNITYSPYNMNHYSPSCSRPIYSNNFANPSVPGVPLKCMQNYPILVHPQRHMCTDCCGSANNNNPMNIKNAASAATNTEPGQERNNEAESLIKEIYHSIALNLHTSKIHHQKSLLQNINRLPNNCAGSINRDNTQIANIVSEIFRNTTINDSSATRHTDTTFVSKPTSNDASVGSQFAMTNQAEAGRAESSDESIDSTSEANDKELEEDRMDQILESDEQSDAVLDQERGQSSSDIDSENIVIEIEKPKHKIESKKKISLFNRMVQMFKLKDKVNKKKAVSVEQDSEWESDTDDYQTVYRQRVINRDSPTRIRSRPHSKIFNSRKHQQRKSPEKARRVPYMEQEHRRYWNEKLMFHDDKHQRYSSGQSRGIDSGRERSPVFAQNFETRNASVNNAIPPTDERPNRDVDYNMKGVHPDVESNYSRVPNQHYNGYNPHQNQGIWINCAGTSNNPNPNSNTKPCIITPRVYTPTHKVVSSKGLTWLRKGGKHFSSCEQSKNFVLEN